MAGRMVQHPAPIDIVRSMRSVFVDAPDLRLRLGQARCLWGAGGTSCRAALRVLVDTGFLSRAADGAYIRRGGDSAVGGPMPPRDAAWDCSWATPVLADAPLWLHGWQAQWTCLKEGGPKILAPRDCEHCPRWEPRLFANGRRAQSRA